MTVLRSLFLLLIATNISLVKGDDFFEIGSPFFHTVAGMETLDSSVITALHQDKEGYIWIGTQEGLLRYDGYQFKVFQHDPENSSSIAGNYVRTIWQTPDDRIWIGTMSNGVSIIDIATNKVIRMSANVDSAKHRLSHNQVRAIFGDDNGRVFIATNNGLNYYDPSRDQVELIEFIDGCDAAYQDKRTRSVLIDSRDSLWLGTTKGLCHIESPSSIGEGTRITGKEYVELNGQNASVLLESRSGDIWVGTTSHGVAKINVSTQQIQRIPQDPSEDGALSHSWAKAITEFEDGTIWIATYGGGINVVDPLQVKVKKVIRHAPAIKSGIISNVVSSFLVDSSGLLWIGYWGGGINTYNFLNQAISILQRYPGRPNQLTSSNITAVSEISNGKLWVGTVNGVVNVIAPKMGVVEHINLSQLIENESVKRTIRVIREFQPGKIWIGTNEGLFHYDLVTGQVLYFDSNDGLPNKQIRTLVKEENLLWIGTDSGVAKMNLDNNYQIEAYAPQYRHLVYELAISPNQDIWVGTTEGLFVIPKNSTDMKRISDDDLTAVNLGNVVVQDLLFSGDKTLWVATTSGLKRMAKWQDDVAVFESINERVGLGNKDLGGNLIQDLAGNIWTSEYKINPNNWQVLNLKKAYGFHLGNAKVGGSTMTKDGLILQSSRLGLLMIRPDRLVLSDYQPHVVITDLEVNNKTISDFETGLTLQPDNKRLSVTFSALDYTYPNLNQYKYKLDGYDEDWMSVAAFERKATYSRLPPGEYRLNIRATNSFGKWSQSEISLPIRQIPHWYETWWFKVGIILTVFLISNGIYRLRIQYLKQQKIQLNEIIKSRTKNIESLGKTGQEITSSLNLEDIFESVYVHIAESMDAYVFLIGIVDKDAHQINVEFYSENDQRCPPISFDLDDTSRPAVVCVSQKQEIITQNLAQLNECVGGIKDPVSGHQTESVVYLPLVVKDEVVGCLSIQSMQQNAYDSNHLFMLRTIASYTAIAIENGVAMRQLRETQAQLVESEKVASLGRLVSGVAHELNTPVGIAITSVSSLGELATQVKEDIKNNKLTKSGITKFVDSSIEIDRLLQKNLGRCANLIKNFKSISADQMTSSPSALTLKSYIQKIVDSHKGRLEEAAINCSITGDDATIFVDAGLVGQVFGNLIDNTIYHAFLEQTDKQVNIAITEQNNNVTIVFADNGVGMDEEQKACIFDPFYTTARNKGLHGLGLNIVYTIIANKLNGSITVMSEKNQGTSFEMVIPTSQTESEGSIH